MTDTNVVVDDDQAISRGEQLKARFAFLRADSVTPIWIGVALIGIGFGLIAYTWGKVAGLTSVPLQLPYFVSGGITALVFVLVGITVVSVAAKRRDAIERDRQIEQLTATMAELRAAIESQA